MKRPGRGLIGYLPRDDAIAALQGGTIIAGSSPPESLLAQWRRAKKAVESRAPVKIESPVVETPPEATAAVEAARRRPDLLAAFAPHKWRVVFVDLSKPVLSYQRIVLVEDAVERVSNADPGNVSTLFDVCLPEGQTVEMEGGFDPGQNAFTTTSLNPNLRVAGFAAVDAVGPRGEPNKVFGFTLSLGSSFLQLAEYKGRWMVRDGYHRIYGLLKRGIHSIPCVVIEAQSFEETGAARPGFFGYELLYSERPPLVADFLSDELSVDVPVPAVRKVVRIRAEEFTIPV